MIKKNVLVIGGSGFIGAEICNIVSKTENVICADNYSRNEQKGNINHNVSHEELDVTNYNKVSSICRNIDVVINLAFINGTRNFYERPRDVFKVALEGQLNVMRAIDENNVKKFIYASSSEVYQSPDHVPTSEKVRLVIPDIMNPRYSYGGGKIVGELMCVHYLPNRVPYQIFRPHNIYGPNMGFEHVIPEFIKKIYKSNINSKNKYPIKVQGGGLSSRSFCYLKDFGRAFKIMWDKGGENQIFNIGTDKEVRILDILNIFSKITKKEFDLITEDLPLGSTERRCPDISKLKKLGYSPIYSLEEGLQKTHDWYLNYL